jgi:hypothetical protein
MALQPQLETFDIVSQPATEESQSRNPALQRATAHLPPLHTPIAFGGWMLQEEPSCTLEQLPVAPHDWQSGQIPERQQCPSVQDRPDWHSPPCVHV